MLKNALSSRTSHMKVRSPMACAAHGRKAIVMRSAQTASPQSTAPVPPQSLAWRSFASNVSGEWEGVTVTFTPEGEPLQLEERFVPEAFREWNVKQYDWQSTCSSLAVPDMIENHIKMTCRRMMPTVGCEADAIAFTEECVENGLLAAFGPDGSYILAPRKLSPKDTKATVELCVVVSNPGSNAPSGSTLASLALTSSGSMSGSLSGSGNSLASGEDAGEAGHGRTVRLRVQHQLIRNTETKKWELSKVDVHHERWDSEYRGLKELSGCGGGMPAFAQQPKVDESLVLPCKLPGEWAKAWAQPGAWATEDHSGPITAIADGALVRLPLGLWLRTTVTGKDGADMQFSAGGMMRPIGDLVPGKQRTTATVALCGYRDGRMVQAVVGRQSAEEEVFGSLFSPIASR